ncbi:hypothetical protein ILUMI_12211 [Ignelater luminosus]|uniref:N-acyl-aliphatic-L-amino acid amidohydrolase n=1 Tax=Ignelater luminosus TaxID=2038154 RepID=A0A8K0CYL7_IGNLU|nr:hypothetical protein ILUMI_12211 [Ignelater luminosus]
MMNDLDQLAIENFREYLRIPSVHPDVNYDDCVTFVKNQAASLGLPVQVYHCFPNKPIVIVTWIGREPDLPSILLNGHMDVVPVFKEEWTHDPFGAVMDENGDIYARGAQDMKSTSIQYLEAIRRLKMDNVTLRRTIHVSFVPDEEILGAEGMGAFVKSKEFEELNVGFALDEGAPNSVDAYRLFYGERNRWAIRIHCPGQTGHGSLLLDNTAGEKVRKILDKFYDLREQEKKKLDDDPSLNTGDVSTINLTVIEGGVQNNVIPSEFVISIDCRFAITVDLEEFEKTLNEWCEEAGEGVWIEFEAKIPRIPPTKLDETNPFWMAFKKTFDDMNAELQPQIFSAASDVRYLRAVNIPGLGFAPMNHTPVLAHAHDEYLNKDIFLRGIGIYYKVIPAVANVEEIPTQQ